MESVSLEKMEESWDVHGVLQVAWPAADGTTIETRHFSSCCSIERGDDGEPVVSNLTTISDEGGY